MLSKTIIYIVLVQGLRYAYNTILIQREGKLRIPKQLIEIMQLRMKQISPDGRHRSQGHIYTSVRTYMQKAYAGAFSLNHSSKGMSGPNTGCLKKT